MFLSWGKAWKYDCSFSSKSVSSVSKGKIQRNAINDLLQRDEARTRKKGGGRREDEDLPQNAWAPEGLGALKMVNGLCSLHCVAIPYIFFFWLRLWHTEVPGPGFQLELQQQREPQHWQHCILYPLSHQGTPIIPFKKDSAFQEDLHCYWFIQPALN